ncbi:MAG: pentapeptide repeat-containing protein [Actinomycetota bacterium]|nr:pentapeptide repeat-containing protein [Actinomycetota bacterium]
MNAELQGWVAVLGGFAAGLAALLKYLSFRSRANRSAAAGDAFARTVDALASPDEARRLAGAILLRRFFDRSTEQGDKHIPYAKEAVAVITALLRGAEGSTFQKLLADGLAHAPDLRHADLQECNLRNAYLGRRFDRQPDMSRADFFQADLSGASLKGAAATEAVFFRAKLQGTILREADLRDADFREADLQGASFDGARLAGARFGGATNVPEHLAALLDGEARVAADGDVRSAVPAPG